MKRLWAWLRSDTGRAVTVAFVPIPMLTYALTTQNRLGYPTPTGWIVGGIALALIYLGWEYYL